MSSVRFVEEEIQCIYIYINMYNNLYCSTYKDIHVNSIIDHYDGSELHWFMQLEFGI